MILSKVYRLWLLHIYYSVMVMWSRSISLENNWTLYRLRTWYFPDKGNFLWGIYHYGALSVAMLIVISTFVLDFFHTDRSIFKIVDLDEAWSFTGNKEKHYLWSWFGLVVLWTLGYISDPKYRRPLRWKLKNNLGLKFCISFHWP